MTRKTVRVLLLALLCIVPSGACAEQVHLYAAGSLKAALTDVADAYEKAYDHTVQREFGPSGLLRQRIENNEDAHVFASANMKHPRTLVQQGAVGPVVLFARNNLCALAQPGLQVSSANLLDVLLDSSVRVGTSTPKADPSGDYAFALFDKAGALKPGSTEVLKAKALQLTGGPQSAKAPEGRNQYGWVMQENRADIFLTYCTNAVLAKKDVNDLQIVQIPQELAVGADYGLLVLNDKSPAAWRLAQYILSPEGQKILSAYGFMTCGIPAK